MARVVGSAIGELRGKLGGQVFSRNKAGAYVRSYVKPVDPGTVAQIRARSAFGAYASLFGSLSGADKALWNEYAQVYYRPKNGTNSGQYTGAQAFNSLYTVTQNARESSVAPTIAINGSAPAMGVTPVPWISAIGSPPTNAVVNALNGLAGEDYPMSFIAQPQVFPNGAFEVILQVGDGSGETLTQFEDPYGNTVGFAVFMSNGNANPGMTYNNPERYLLGYVQPALFNDPSIDLNSVATVQINQPFPQDISIYKSYPYTGQSVMLTVYAVDKWGTMAKIGSRETTIA